MPWGCMAAIIWPSPGEDDEAGNGDGMSEAGIQSLVADRCLKVQRHQLFNSMMFKVTLASSVVNVKVSFSQANVVNLHVFCFMTVCL